MNARNRLARLASARRCPSCNGTGIGDGAAPVQAVAMTDELAAQVVAIAARIVAEELTEPTTAALAVAADLADPCYRQAATEYLAALDPRGSPDG